MYPRQLDSVPQLAQAMRPNDLRYASLRDRLVWSAVDAWAFQDHQLGPPSTWRRSYDPILVI